MKKSIKFLSVLLCVIMLFALTATNAFAAQDAQTKAEALFSLGLAKGYDDTGKNFGLEDKLTRAQAVVLVVRYLGVEEEVLNSNYKTKFTDLPTWGEKHIGYAFENKIANGISATAFNSDAPVTEAQFLTFLLRAMEYVDTDGADFVWDNPFALAKSLGMTLSDTEGKNFVRGNVFDICFATLSAKTKSGSSVAEKLISANVFTAAAYESAVKTVTDTETPPAAEGSTTSGEAIITEVASAENVIRIACIGDSITAGTGASNKSLYSYPARLQKYLGNNYVVGNFGRGAAYVLPKSSPYLAAALENHSIAMSYKDTEEYEYSLKFNPDYVIIALTTNDAVSMTDIESVAALKEAYTDLVNIYRNLSTKPVVCIATPIVRTDNEARIEVLQEYIIPMLRELAKELDCPLIDNNERTADYFSYTLEMKDRLHPCDDTYTVLARSVKCALLGEEFKLPEAPKAKNGVVYVSSKGDFYNDGATPEKAIGNLNYAIKMVEDGGTIVVCDSFSVNGEMHAVENSGKITVTSVYGGVDYRQTNAAELKFAKNVYLNGDFEFKDVTFNCTASGLVLVCNFNNVTFGEGLKCGYSGGANTNFVIVSGHNVSNQIIKDCINCERDCTIVINDGTFGYIRGGNRRAITDAPFGTVKAGATLTVTINGGTFTNSAGPNVLTATGMNSVDGNVVLNINGGNFAGPIYGVCRSGTNTSDALPHINGNISINIAGGTFSGSELLAVQDETSPKIGGAFSLKISGGTFSSLTKLSGAGAAKSTLTLSGDAVKYKSIATDFTDIK